MDSVKKWSTIISVMYIVCVLMQFLIPPGKISKTMNMILGIFMISSVIVTIRQESNKDILNIKSIIETSKLNVPNEFDETIKSQISELTAENIKSLIKSKLNNIGIFSKKIEIFMDTNEDNCILMIKCKIFLEKKYAQYKVQLYDEILKDLNIKTEFVDV